MRKSTYLLLSLMLSLVYSSAWAAVGDDGKLTTLTQLDNTQAFTLTAVRGTFASNADGTALAKAASKDATDTKQQFAFVKKNKESTTFYIYNISAGKFVGGDGANVTLSSVGDEFELIASQRIVNVGTVEEPINVTYDWMIKRTTDNKYLMFNGGANPELSTWNTPDDGDVFIIGDAVDATEAIQYALGLLNTVNVTYKVQFNGNVVATQDGKAVIGQTPELPDALKRDFYTYNYVGGDVTSTTTEVTFNAIWAGPFDLSADYANAKWYNMYIRNAGFYISYAENATQYPVNKNCTDAQLASNAFQWAFVSGGYGQVQVLNKAAGDGLTLKADGNPLMRNGATSWDIFKSGEGFVLRENGTDNNYINQNGGENGNFGFWNDGGARNDVGSRLNLTAVPETPIVTVTYSVKYNGNEVTSLDLPVEQGGAIPAIPTSLEREFVTLSDKDNKVGTTVNENTTVEVSATWNGPFSISADFNSAEWKNLTINGKYVNYATSEPYPNVANAKDAQRATDEFQWAFIGNPYAIVIVNKAGGANNSLSLQGTGNGAALVLRAGSFVESKSFLKSEKTEGDNGFAMRYSTGVINDYNGTFALWAAGGNGGDGSRMYVVDVPEPDYAAAVAEEVTPWMESAGKLFGLKQSVYDANVSTYTAALESCNKATYDALKAAVVTADAINEPETGFYRIYNMANRWKTGKGYLGVRSDGNLSANIIANGASDGNLGVNPEWAATVIRVEKVDGGYSFAVNGQYIGQPDGDKNIVPLGEDAELYTYRIVKPGVVRLQATNGQQLHRGNNKAKDIIGYNEAGGPCDFYFEDAENVEIPLTLVANEKNYAMMVVPFDATLSNDGTIAYAITADGNGAKAVVLGAKALANGAVCAKGVQVEGNTIPAGTSVLLESANETASLSIGEGYAATPSSDGDLVGSYVATDAPADALALGVNGEGELGFFQAPAAASANSAYFTGTAGVLTLDDTVGINKTASETIAVDAIYGADGIKQSRLLPGLNFIRQGNKVIKVIK